jgi:hypothetical protein
MDLNRRMIFGCALCAPFKAGDAIQVPPGKGKPLASPA